MEKRLVLLMKERQIVEKLRMLPEQAKKLILRQYDNEINMILKEIKEDEDVES